MTVTTLERVELIIDEDFDRTCQREACLEDKGPARWIVRARHGGSMLYCETCREALVAFAGRAGLKFIYCGWCKNEEWFDHISEVISSMERV